MEVVEVDDAVVVVVVLVEVEVDVDIRVVEVVVAGVVLVVLLRINVVEVVVCSTGSVVEVDVGVVVVVDKLEVVLDDLVDINDILGVVESMEVVDVVLVLSGRLEVMAMVEVLVSKELVGEELLEVVEGSNMLRESGILGSVETVEDEIGELVDRVDVSEADSAVDVVADIEVEVMMSPGLELSKSLNVVLAAEEISPTELLDDSRLALDEKEFVNGALISGLNNVLEAADVTDARDSGELDEALILEDRGWVEDERVSMLDSAEDTNDDNVSAELTDESRLDSKDSSGSG